MSLTRFVLSESKFYFYPQARDLLGVCKLRNFFYPDVEIKLFHFAFLPALPTWRWLWWLELADLCSV